MKYFIIAGEQSGDLHGSNLITGLKDSDPDAEFFCWGGDMMEAAGARLLMHYKKLAFMGFIAVLKNIRTINRNMSLCRKQIMELKPDVVIFIDYPGFNLRIAEFAKNEGFRTFYYISPKLWAWNERRVEKVRKFIDRMFIIFPFEVEFYRKHGVSVAYNGNPLVDEMEKRKATLPSASEFFRSIGQEEKPVIALLAGSRKHEIEYVLPQMVSVVSQFPRYRFILAGVKNIPDEFYMKYLGDADVTLVKERTYEILNISTAALVTSGTATLETALMDIPQVVCYRAAFLEMLIAWMVIRVKFISLVNLIMEKEVVKELVQYNLNKKNISLELGAILPGGIRREQVRSDYSALKAKLGPAGASARVAAAMVTEMQVVKKRGN